MKHYHLWIGKLVPKSSSERVLKELNPIPLIEGQYECEFDLDEKSVPMEWVARLFDAKLKDGHATISRICRPLPMGFNSLTFPDTVRLHEVKRK